MLELSDDVQLNGGLGERALVDADAHRLTFVERVVDDLIDAVRALDSRVAAIERRLNGL